MSTATNTHQPESTFRNYDSKDAARYAEHRFSYNPALIQLIYDTHTSTGGHNIRVLDIGCGPGIATRQIASYFEHVLGIDASPSMIEQAQQTSCLSASGEQAQFSVCNSEDIAKVFEPGSIDLITIATAAHWFDMPKFYTAASQVLKPGGSIAMWCGGKVSVDPETTPNAANVQKLWDQCEDEILVPFYEIGNRLCQDLYIDLPMPWTIDSGSVDAETSQALTLFDQTTSMRRTFNEFGQKEDGELLSKSEGYVKKLKMPLVNYAKMLSTASPITRWRQAHKEQVEKGEIEDCVDRMLRLTREEMDKADGGKEREWLESSIAMVLVVVKKKA